MKDKFTGKHVYFNTTSRVQQAVNDDPAALTTAGRRTALFGLVTVGNKLPTQPRQPIPPFTAPPGDTTDASASATTAPPVIAGPSLDPTLDISTIIDPIMGVEVKPKAKETTVTLDAPLTRNDVMAVARGAKLVLSAAAIKRINESREVAKTFFTKNTPVYGLNTGVGALADTIVTPDQRREASKQIVLTHAVGIGDKLGEVETRAILTAAINNFSRGWSGIRVDMVQHLADMLNKGVLPEVLDGGSIGYLIHMAHIGLVAIGEGHATVDGVRMTGAEALAKVGMVPLVLEAGEGLSMVQGTPCVIGLACTAIERMDHAIDWAVAVSAMTFEVLGGQLSCLEEKSLALRKGGHLQEVGAKMNLWLKDSAMLKQEQGVRTQDSLSLRTIPAQIGATIAVLANLKAAIKDELESVTDNPAVGGTPEYPEVYSHSHAVAVNAGLHLDFCATAISQLVNQAEMRIKRLLNHDLTGLNPYLASDKGGKSGLMILDYTVRDMAQEIKSYSMPVSVAGGTTSGLQEDFLAYPTPAARKLLKSIALVEQVLAGELLAVCQAYDLKGMQKKALQQSPRTQRLLDKVRETLPLYKDDRPLSDALKAATEIVRTVKPKELL
jgi:histidine ammonia-lyase